MKLRSILVTCLARRIIVDMHKYILKLRFCKGGQYSLFQNYSRERQKLLTADKI
ncbi:hypothetical protein TWF696_002449 [Orbilia brochopaga]|uniref:Uncharacterized protein n=1 Tax=Orbilia brochopaga TaxID=3140254 RepID=A0AAV9U883_9PEZI